MISIHEVFLTDEIRSINSISEQERRNLNAYLLDHYSMAFKDIHSEAFNAALKKAIINSAKSINIPIHIVKIVNSDKDSFKDTVIFQEV